MSTPTTAPARASIIPNDRAFTVQFHPEACSRTARHGVSVRPNLSTIDAGGSEPCRFDKNIKKVLVIGSGPIVIGQAAEFDYAGAQACRVLKDAGVDVVLVNSNPATIMTDKALADEIYLEPLTIETVKRIIEKEKPDSILAGLGGQTGLTLAMQLAKEGFLACARRRVCSARMPRRSTRPRTARCSRTRWRPSASRSFLPTSLSSVDHALADRGQDRLSRHRPPRVHAGRRGRRRRV